eukprot:Tbor_TRINITY_DN4831_c0_g1::TRINITY_DN4831_c0_g1_i1::g.1234::m.1234
MEVIETGDDMLPHHLLNKVNREIAKQIAFYDSEIDKKAHEVKDHKERLNFMQEHLANVKAEILNMQSLFESKRREIESEDHLCQLVERGRGRLKQKIEQASEKQSEVQEKLDMIQNRIFQGNLRMDEFRTAMNFNQEELEQWDIARKQKEDDTAALDKYTKADEAKTRDLNFQIETTTKKILQKREELDAEITETQSAQIELDKTAEDYKNVHQERQNLIKQWEEAIKAMHERDNAINSADERYNESKQWLEKRRKVLKARADLHELEIKNGKEIEGKIGQEDRVLSKYKDDVVILTKHLTDLEDEVEALQSSLSKATEDKNNAIARRNASTQELKDKQTNFERMQKQHQHVIDKLKDEMNAASDLNKQNTLVADLLAQTEQSAKMLEKEIVRIKDEMYQNSHLLHTVRKDQANYLAEISQAQAQGRNMNAKITQLDAESLKQQELLYSIEYNIQQMERKVNRSKGERTEEEKRELQEKIEVLQKMHDDLMKHHKMLNIQVKLVNDELRQSKHDVTTLEKQKETVSNVALELTIENESWAIELQTVNKAKEEVLVNGDILKLQIERLRKKLHDRDEELMGLENRKKQIEITVMEREMEIAVHQDVIKMEAKMAEEERKAVATELTGRLAQISHLKSRYEVLIGRMDKEQGQMTHAQHVVRTAKEREALQNTGDTLDADIKKSERDMLKIDKTISLLKGSNLKYRHQFRKVVEGDEELVQKKLLRQKSKELQTIINRRNNEVKEVVQTELAKMSELRDRQRELNELKEKYNILQDGEKKLLYEIEHQKELVARCELNVLKNTQQLEDIIVDDITLIEERENQADIVRMLVSIGKMHGNEVFKGITQTLDNHGIGIPSFDEENGDNAEDSIL